MRKENNLWLGIILGMIILFLPATALTEIDSCTVLDTNYEVYELNQSITDGTPNKCIEITANHTTLDCKGFTIDGDNSAPANYGIFLSSVNNVTVKNCIIQKHDRTGLVLDGSDNNNITNNTISNLSTVECTGGISIDTSNLNIFSNCTVSDTTGHGMWFITSNNNSVDNCTIKSHTGAGSIGIKFDRDSDWNNVSFSRIENNTGYGIYFENYTSSEPYVWPDNCYVYNNFFNNTNNYGDNYNPTSLFFNITTQLGTRIYSDGNYIGGNFWTNSTGDDFSNTCTDSDKDGFCDSTYTVATGVTDYLPYSNEGDTTAPTITIISPESKTYGTISIDLNWSTDETLDLVWFSLNGDNNITNISQQTKLDDDTTKKNITSNITLYVKIPKQSSIISGELDLNGYEFINTTRSQSSYSCSGTFRSGYPCSNAVDLNWGTLAETTDDSDVYIYENITIDSTDVTIDWTTKYYSDHDGADDYFKTYCWNYSSSSFSLIDTQGGIGTGTKNITIPSSCIQNPLQIQTRLSAYASVYITGYFEGLANINYLYDYPENIQIDIGNDGAIDWNLTTKLNSSNSPQKVSLNLTAIQNYLLSCSTDSDGWCDVPLVFSANQWGNLEISDIIINYINSSIKFTAIEGSNNITVWANDSVGNMNSTIVYFTVTADSCTPPASGTWEIDSTDHCAINDETINIDYIYFTDSGTITFDNCDINVKAFERKSGDGGAWTDIIIQNYTNVTIDING